MGDVGPGNAEAPLQAGLLHLKGMDAAGKKRGPENYLGGFACKAKWVRAQLLDCGGSCLHKQKVQESLRGAKAEEKSEDTWKELLEFLDHPEPEEVEGRLRSRREIQ